MATTATNHRTGDPAVLEAFDAWVSTPLAYTDDKIDANNDIIVRNGEPVVLGVIGTDRFDMHAHWIASQPAGATIAVKPTNGGELLVMKMTPVDYNGNHYNLNDADFDLIIDAVPVVPWKSPTGQVYEITVVWPLGWHHDGDNNRVSINDV